MAENNDALMAVSPPARGAWIEIDIRQKYENRANVAPRTGGVD